QYRARMEVAAPLWQCPMCEAGAEAAQDPCGACGAVLNLQDLDALLGREIHDPVPLRAAIERYEAALRARANGEGAGAPASAGSSRDAGADFDTHYWLGLAYANGKQLAPAVRHLQAAVRLRPGERAFRAQVVALAQRQAELEAQAKARELKAPARSVLVVDDS